MWAILRAHWRRALPIVAILASTLSLIAVGIIYLFEKGLFLWWCLAAATLGLLAFVVSRLERSTASPRDHLPPAEPDSAWTPREREAWSDVLSLADQVAAAPPTSRDEIKAHGIKVVTAVATRLHPGAEFASAHFTIPDVLKAFELAIRDLRSQVVRRVPGSDVIRLSDLLLLQKLYEKYGSAGRALWLAYRVYRMFLNPLQAVTQEITGWLTEEGTGKAWHVAKGQVARSLVLELGRSAIDLYGGRLRATQAELEQALIEAVPPVVAPLPVRIVVAGQIKGGKSSLINALLDAVRAPVSELPATTGVAEYRLQAADRPDLVLIDTPGLDGGKKTQETVLETIQGADLVIWAVSAANPARKIDQEALRALQSTYEAQPDRRPPTLMIAATHVDRLPPRREWSPPYDVSTPRSEKAANIRSALDQITVELRMPNAVVVPMALPPEELAYNVESLWVAVFLLLDEARQTALRRALEDRPGFSVRKAVWQVWEGGRFVGRLVLDGALSRLH